MKNYQDGGEAILEAFKKRHVYGATDHIIAEFRSGDHIMGDIFSTGSAPRFTVKLEGTAPFKKVHVIKNNQYVYSTDPGTAKVSFTWADTKPDAGKQSYYYVRGEQADGEQGEAALEVAFSVRRRFGRMASGYGYNAAYLARTSGIDYPPPFYWPPAANMQPLSRRFRDVIVPNALPGILAGILMVVSGIIFLLWAH